jgi:hypothetical protein
MHEPLTYKMLRWQSSTPLTNVSPLQELERRVQELLSEGWVCRLAHFESSEAVLYMMPQTESNNPDEW